MIARGEIISYVANKLGGVHWDESRSLKRGRDESFAVLDAMRNNVYATFSSGSVSYTVRVRDAPDDLEKWRRDLVLKSDHLDVAMLDLIHTAKLIVRAPGVQQLRQALDSALR